MILSHVYLFYLIINSLGCIYFIYFFCFCLFPPLFCYIYVKFVIMLINVFLKEMAVLPPVPQVKTNFLF